MSRASGPPGRTRRRGSKALLAAGLAAAVAAAFYAGARLADLAAKAAGLSSRPVVLGAKVLLTAAALPAGFYLVERFFLGRSSRRKSPGDPGGSSPGGKGAADP